MRIILVGASVVSVTVVENKSVPESSNHDYQQNKDLLLYKYEVIYSDFLLLLAERAMQLGLSNTIIKCKLGNISWAHLNFAVTCFSKGA